METWQAILSIMGMFVIYFIFKYVFRKGAWVSERKRLSPDGEKIDYVVGGRSFNNYWEAKKYAQKIKWKN